MRGHLKTTPPRLQRRQGAPLVRGEEALVLVLFLQVRASEQNVFNDFGFIWATILCDIVYQILIEYMTWQLLIGGVNNPFSASSGQNVFSYINSFTDTWSIDESRSRYWVHVGVGSSRLKLKTTFSSQRGLCHFKHWWLIETIVSISIPCWSRSRDQILVFKTKSDKIDLILIFW